MDGKGYESKTNQYALQKNCVSFIYSSKFFAIRPSEKIRYQVSPEKDCHPVERLNITKEFKESASTLRAKKECYCLL